MIWIKNFAQLSKKNGYDETAHDELPEIIFHDKNCEVIAKYQPLDKKFTSTICINVSGLEY